MVTVRYLGFIYGPRREIHERNDLKNIVHDFEKDTNDRFLYQRIQLGRADIAGLSINKSTPTSFSGFHFSPLMPLADPRLFILMAGVLNISAI